MKLNLKRVLMLLAALTVGIIANDVALVSNGVTDLVMLVTNPEV